MIRRAGELIDAFRVAEGPPPRTLGAFFLWALSGSFPVLWFAGAISALAGTLEVMSALLLGRVIDSAISSEKATFFADNWLLLLGVMAFSCWRVRWFLACRPWRTRLWFCQTSIPST